MHIQSPKMRLLITTLFFTISHSYPINPTIRPWWFAATTIEPIIPEPNQTNAPDSEHKINKNSKPIYVQYPGFGQTSTSFNWANKLWDSWLTNVFDIQPSFDVVQQSSDGVPNFLDSSTELTRNTDLTRDTDFAGTENYNDFVHSEIDEISDRILDEMMAVDEFTEVVEMADEILKNVGEDIIDTIILDYEYSGEAKFTEYVGKLEKLVEDGKTLDVKISYNEQKTESIETIDQHAVFIENDGFNVYAVTSK